MKKYHKRTSMVETTSETNEYHMQGFIQGIFVRWGEHLAGVYLGGGQGGGGGGSGAD